MTATANRVHGLAARPCHVRRGKEGGMTRCRLPELWGDQQLEQTLERFRRDLLSRSAEDYRNDPGAMTSLTEGLTRLRENAVNLARGDAREIVARFGQLGARKLAAVG